MILGQCCPAINSLLSFGLRETGIGVREPAVEDTPINSGRTVRPILLGRSKDNHAPQVAFCPALPNNHPQIIDNSEHLFLVSGGVQPVAETTEFDPEWRDILLRSSSFSPSKLVR